MEQVNKLLKPCLEYIAKKLPLLIFIANIITLIFLLTAAILLFLGVDEFIEKLADLTAWVCIGGLFYLLLIKAIARIDYDHRGPIFVYARKNLPHLRKIGFLVFYNALIHAYTQVIFKLQNGDSPLTIVLGVGLVTIILFLMFITSFFNLKTRMKGWQYLHSMVWMIPPIVMSHVLMVTDEVNIVFILFTVIAYAIFFYEVLQPKLRKIGIKHLIIYTLGIVLASVIFLNLG